MAGPTTRVATADVEAAAWHARLGVRSVSTETLEEFFAWKAAAGNADAWRRVEKAWAVSERLGGDADIQAAVAEAMGRGVGKEGLKRRYREVLFAVAAATAVAVLGLGGWLWFDRSGALTTGIGEQKSVQLADGSTVRLDTDSVVRVRMSGEERRILLDRGQALFDVVHDPARPFVVDAGETEVVAVGTVFDVRRTGGPVVVTLVEGAVDVVGGARAAPARIRAGQQARVSAGGAVATRVVDTASATSWTEGRLVFADTPLRAAVAEVNRYLAAPVVLDTGVSGDTPVNGVFRTGDRAAFASAAAEGLGLEVRGEPDGSLRLLPGKNI